MEVRGVFLEIPKTFDCVWDKGLHCKIKCDLLNLMESSLFERQQWVILNEQESEWKAIKAGVPQGSVLVPLFIIIIYIYIYIYIYI